MFPDYTIHDQFSKYRNQARLTLMIKSKHDSERVENFENDSTYPKQNITT